MDPAVIQQMGERWELGDEIGSGAIARVVRVRDRTSGQIYAAKLLHPRHQRDEAARTRFQREAELSSRLVDDNLVRVWGTDTIAGHVAMVMELVEGPTLARHLARTGPLPEAELIAIAFGIASGLAHAHAAGVIHRDLKPANVLLAPTPHGWIPKIADFGMARASSFAEADRGALTVLGTPPYMAPECLDPLAVDPRTDLYALGCMLFELASGAPPFSGATPFAVLEAHRSAPIPGLGGRVSPGLDRLIRQLLAKSAGDRPQSSAAVASALDELRAPGGALVPLDDPAVAAAAIAAGRCAGCGSDILEDVRVCFRCGAAPVMIEPGDHRVLVVGPGRISDKLDSTRRDRLVQWLKANASVGFDPSKLSQEIPRFPFVLVRGVSLASANTIVDSMAKLGLQAEATTRGALAHPAMRTHLGRMAGRRSSLVAAIVLAPSLGYMPLMVVLFPLVFVAVTITAGITIAAASRTTVASTPTRHAALPAALDQRVRALQSAVPQIRERRHREALGAVVGRVLTLMRDLSPDDREGAAAELAHAINLATVASRRMDEIEGLMARADFDPSNPEHRGFMQERDTWAARLLDLTASLDALVARRSAARAQVGLVHGEDLLRDVRSTVEALEEIQRT